MDDDIIVESSLVIDVLNELGERSIDIGKRLELFGAVGTAEDNNCPIAVYLKNRFPDKTFRVRDSFIDEHEKGSEVKYHRTPKEVAQFINDFDRGLYPSLDQNKNEAYKIY